jgi:hypothetical protein
MTKSLLHAVGMPFQLASLLFVMVCALILTVAFTIASGSAGLAISLLALVVVLVWLVQYAFIVLDAAANGLAEVPAASAEMLSPFADERGWIHPAIIAATTITLMLNPDLPKWPVVVAAGTIFPASIAATVISGRALDALNPVAISRVIAAMGALYVIPVCVFLLCTLACLWVAGLDFWLFPRLMVMGLLLLCAYACIGGTIHTRHSELGFAARVSSERVAEQMEVQRTQRRQQWIDSLYQLVLVRDHARSASTARQWLAAAAAHELPADVAALLASGRSWNQPKSYCQLLRSVVTQLLEQQQPALALQVTEAALGTAQEFALAQEGAAVALARFALQTSRRRLAATILDNYLAVAGSASPGRDLLALLQQLREALRPNS